MTDRVWKQLEQSTWIGDGKSNAPRIVYTFTA
jgi:thiol:disulfide interchange protein DsbG